MEITAVTILSEINRLIEQSENPLDIVEIRMGKSAEFTYRFRAGIESPCLPMPLNYMGIPVVVDQSLADNEIKIIERGRESLEPPEHHWVRWELHRYWNKKECYKTK